MTNEDNGRTHEPSLRELTAEIDGTKELFKSEIKRLEEISDERHDRYKERAEAAEDRVGVAFDAAKEAKSASDQAQKDYNVNHNDLIRKGEQQAKDTLPREEAKSEFTNIRTEIDFLRKDVQGLRESRSEAAGTPSILMELTKEIRSLRESRAGSDATKVQVMENRNREQWTTGTLISIVFGILGTLSGIFSITYIVIKLAQGH